MVLIWVAAGVCGAAQDGDSCNTQRRKLHQNFARLRFDCDDEIRKKSTYLLCCNPVQSSKGCAGLLRKASSSILNSLIHVFIEIQARRFGEAQASASKH
jgi:hypothetical protein